jgi:hypothetical protein
MARSGILILVVVLLVAVFVPIAQAYYAIGYVNANTNALHQEQLHEVGASLTFSEAPDALHVADLVARLNGHPPLLHEGTTNHSNTCDCEMG